MGSMQRPGPFNVKKVAIIGAGPSGLAVAKFLLAEGAFDKIDVFEQQSEVGGVWNYAPDVAGHIPIPSTSAHEPPEKPVYRPGSSEPRFSNPMYDKLNTNIPKDLMQFSDQDFLPESLLFPTREDVQDYLVKYSQDVRHLVHFSTQVESIHLIDQEISRWELTAKSTVTNKERKDNYDAIVVSNGHYSVPWIPAVKGMEQFNQKHPSIISHSKIYRSPTPFTDKKVVVVGSAASGLDIANQISRVCRKPLLNSVRTLSGNESGQETKEEVPRIVEFLANEKGVRFEDGRVETNIDAIVFCTGYLYAYPFLETIKPAIVTSGRRVRGTYKQLFNIAHPTIAFIALPKKIIPFPFAEAQGAAIAKVWTNKLELPSTEEMNAAEQQELDQLEEGADFHVFGYPKDAEYINGLHDWVGGARGGFAREPAHWSKKHLHMRDIYIDIRKAFVESGEKAKTLGELGLEI